MTTSQETPRGARAVIAMLVSLVVFTAADLGTKEWALENLSAPRMLREGQQAEPVCQPSPSGLIHYQRDQSGTIVLIEDLLELRYAENCGAAFGMLRTAPSWVRASVFGVAALAACVVLGLMFFRGAGGPLFAASVPLVLSGAIGNLVDRIRHGYVVDFILVHVTDTYDWPTFNVADATITVGVVLLLLDGMRRQEQPDASPTAQAGGAD